MFACADVPYVFEYGDYTYANRSVLFNLDKQSADKVVERLDHINWFNRNFGVCVLELVLYTPYSDLLTQVLNVLPRYSHLTQVLTPDSGTHTSSLRYSCLTRLLTPDSGTRTSSLRYSCLTRVRTPDSGTYTSSLRYSCLTRVLTPDSGTHTSSLRYSVSYPGTHTWLRYSHLLTQVLTPPHKNTTWS